MLRSSSGDRRGSGGDESTTNTNHVGGTTPQASEDINEQATRSNIGDSDDLVPELVDERDRGAEVSAISSSVLGDVVQSGVETGSGLESDSEEEEDTEREVVEGDSRDDDETIFEPGSETESESENRITRRTGEAIGEQVVRRLAPLFDDIVRADSDRPQVQQESELEEEATREVETDVEQNNREVLALARLIDSTGGRFHRLSAEREAEIARDPHSAMNTERIARVNRHFFSKVLPSVHSDFAAYMSSDWFSRIDVTLVSPHRMLCLIKNHLQEISDDPVELGDSDPGRIIEQFTSICGSQETSPENLIALFTRLNRDDLLPESSYTYTDLSSSLPELEEEELTEFPFSDPNIIEGANRVLLTLKFRLLEEIVRVCREYTVMGLEEEELPLSAENIEWLDTNKIIIALGEIDTLEVDFERCTRDIDLSVGAYVRAHNSIIARSREILQPHTDCGAISAYRNFDYTLRVSGEHGNPFYPGDTEHAFTVTRGLVGTDNSTAASHVQVLAAFYYLGAIDNRHPDSDRMRWLDVVGQLEDIRNTYGLDSVSCYPGAVSRIAKFTDHHPELSLPDTMLNIVRRAATTITSRAVCEYFDSIREADYLTRRNAYIALLTFNSFNTDQILTQEMLSSMGQSLNLLYYIRDYFMQTFMRVGIGEYLNQIQLEVLARHPGCELGEVESALARAMYYNVSDTACLAIRGNFFSTLSSEERSIFEAEDEDTDHSRTVSVLASAEHEIYTAYLEAREALEEEFNGVSTHADFLRFIHSEAINRVRAGSIARFGIQESLVEQEIRDQHLSSTYRATASNLLRLREHNASITWSDDDIERRILSQINMDNRSLWFSCSRPDGGEIPESDEPTSDYVSESLQQAAIRLHLQRRYVIDSSPAPVEIPPNNIEVVRIANEIRSASVSYETRNRRFNQRRAAQTESSMDEGMLQIGMEHFHHVMLPYLREDFLRYTHTRWIELLDSELATHLARHNRIISWAESLISDDASDVSEDEEFSAEDNRRFLVEIGLIGQQSALPLSLTSLDEAAEDGDCDDASVTLQAGELVAYTFNNLVDLFSRIETSEAIVLPEYEEVEVRIELNPSSSGSISLNCESQEVQTITDRILLRVRARILDTIISEAGDPGSPIDEDLGVWLRENRSILLFGRIELSSSSFPRELSSYIYAHNSIVDEASTRLNTIYCDSINAWNCLDLDVELSRSSYPHPFDPDSQGMFVSSPELSASSQRAGAHQAASILAIVALNTFEEGDAEDVSGVRWASLIGQLSDILNANGRRRVSCYPGAIGRILHMADEHPTISMPVNISEFVINSVRQMLVSQLTDYFRVVLLDASYNRRRDSYLALMSFSSFHAQDIIDGTMREAMGVSLNRLSHAWNEIIHTVFLGDMENIFSHVRHMVVQEYRGHILDQRQEALLVHAATDISAYTAVVIRNLFIDSMTESERAEFLQAEQDSEDEIYQASNMMSDSPIYEHYIRLSFGARREHPVNEEQTHIEQREVFFREVFNPTIDAIVALPSVRRDGISREAVIREIRDMLLTRRYQGLAQRFIDLRNRTPSVAQTFSDERVEGRVIRDISDDLFSLWFNCRRSADARNETSDDDFALGEEPIEQAVMRLMLRQRFIVDTTPAIEVNPATPVSSLPETIRIREHVSGRLGLQSYSLRSENDLDVRPISQGVAGVNYNRMSNVNNVRPYGSVLHLPAVPMILPYHPTGSSRTGGGITRVYLALDTGVRGVDFSHESFNPLRSICEQFGISSELSEYDISSSLVVQDYPFSQPESMLARAHPWLHSDAPETGSYTREDRVYVASLIDGRARVLSRAPASVFTHGAQRSSSCSVVFSPQNLEVWTPSASEVVSGNLADNKLITTIYIESNVPEGRPPRIKIATTVILTNEAALALNTFIGSLREGGDAALRAILTRRNFAEIISVIDANFSSHLQLSSCMPLDIVRGANVREERRVLTRSNAFRISSSSRRIRRRVEYEIPDAISSSSEEVEYALTTDLRIDRDVSFLRYNRLTNVDTCGPYSASLRLPRLPMLHPYNPNGSSDSQARINGGITTVLIAAELEVISDTYNLFGLIPGIATGVSIPITTSIVVQDCPFRNTTLIGRAHPWIHPEAPETGSYSRQSSVHFALVSQQRVNVFNNCNVHTHGHGASDPVVFSPNNIALIDIGSEGLLSNRFYTTICAVVEGGAVSRVAITSHILLTDSSTASLSSSIDRHIGEEASLEPGVILSLLQEIPGFIDAEHLPWNMVARASLAADTSVRQEERVPLLSPVPRFSGLAREISSVSPVNRIRAVGIGAPANEGLRLQDNLQILRVQSITEPGSDSIDTLTNLYPYDNPTLGGRHHYLLPVLNSSRDTLLHPLIAVTYGHDISYVRLQPNMRNWLSSICGDSVHLRDVSISINFSFQHQLELATDESYQLSILQSVPSAGDRALAVAVSSPDSIGIDPSVQYLNLEEDSTDDDIVSFSRDATVAYSCIYARDSSSISLTLHVLAPRDIYSLVATGISSRDSNGARLVTSRLENLLVYMLGVGGPDISRYLDELAILHNSIVREVPVNISSDLDALSSASNVDYVVTNLGEHLPNAMVRVAPIINNSGRYDLRMPVCLRGTITDNLHLPEAAAAFLSENSMRFADVDVEIYFVVQSNPYVRGECARFSIDTIVNQMIVSNGINFQANITSVINPIQGVGDRVNRNIVCNRGQASFDILLSEQESVFDTVTLINPTSYGHGRPKLVITHHGLVSPERIDLISRFLNNELSEVDPLYRGRNNCHSLNRVVMTLSRANIGDSLLRSLFAFASIAYQHTRPNLPYREERFLESSGSPYYHQQFLLDFEDVDRFRDAFIRLYVVSSPGISYTRECVERLASNLEQPQSFFNQNVIEAAIRHNNSRLLRQLRLLDVNILNDEIGLHGPLILCLQLGHEECAVEHLLAGYRVDDDLMETISELDILESLQSVNQRAEGRMSEIRAEILRTPSPMDLEDVATEDHYEGLMRRLFDLIRRDSIDEFEELFVPSSEQLLSRVYAGHTLATYCADQGRTGILVSLSENGVDINLSRPHDLMTPLHVAADHVNLDMIRSIISISTSSRNQQNIFGQTPADVLRSRDDSAFDENLFRTEEEIIMSREVSARRVVSVQ